tara:strand:- start:2014 stop:3813 length:1800 start_codon:yes stop_codon:yes gene_type:complete
MVNYIKGLKRNIIANVGGLQQITLSFWAFGIFYPALNFVFYIFAGISIFQIILEKRWKGYKFSKEKIPYLLLILYVLWNIFTLVYTEDIYYGIKQVEKKIPLLIIGILGLFSNKQDFDFKKILSFYYYGMLSVITLCIVYSAYMLITDYYMAIALVQGFTNINLLNIFEHRLYIGISLLMITPLIFEEIIHEKKTINIVSKLILLLISFYLIYSSGSRILLIAMICIVFLLVYNYLKPKLDKRISLSLLLISIIFAFSIVYFHPRTKLTLDLISKNKPLSKLDNRFVTWENATEIILDNPIFGTGLGDAKNQLFASYKKNGNLIELENELNVHNQYLQIILESGLIGFFLFSGFAISLYTTNKDKKIYILTGIAVFGLSFIIESVLSRNLGVFPLAFWLYIIVSSDIKVGPDNLKDDKKIKKVTTNFFAVFYFIVLTSMFIFSKYQTFDKTNPNTYMTTPFKYIKYSELPKKDQLPMVTDACSLSLTDNFTKYERGIFVAPEILSTKKDIPVSLNYGIWCYISIDSDINEAYIYAWDKVNLSFTNKYNLNKKGTWQYLTLNEKSFSNSFTAGVRIDLLKEFPEMKGNIYFALPKYDFNE